MNDTPEIVGHDVRPDKGYIARGRYRKFVTHTVLTMTLPKTRFKRRAQQAIAIARRRAHEVIGHFRIDWRNPPAKDCEHSWEPGPGKTVVCRHCQGRKMYIPKHQRGDAGLGIVVHNFVVTHEAGT
jgi:hypothetical protein